MEDKVSSWCCCRMPFRQRHRKREGEAPTLPPSAEREGEAPTLPPPSVEREGEAPTLPPWAVERCHNTCLSSLKDSMSPSQIGSAMKKKGYSWPFLEKEIWSSDVGNDVWRETAWPSSTKKNIDEASASSSRTEGNMALSSDYEGIDLLSLKWKCGTKVSENVFNTLEVELKFLTTFLKYVYFPTQGIEGHRKLEPLLVRATAVSRKALQDLKWLDRLNKKDEKEISTVLTNIAAHFADDLISIKPHIRVVHWMVSRSSRYDNKKRMSVKSREFFIEFIDSVLENLTLLPRCMVDLVDPLKIKLEDLERKLTSLRSLIVFASMKRIVMEHEHNLLILAQVVAKDAAYLAYSCLADEMDEKHKVDNLVLDLSNLVRAIDPATPDLRQIYIKTLKACSESTGAYLHTSRSDEAAAVFLESLSKSAKELLCADLGVHTRDQIKILREELAFLRIFLLDPPRLHAGNTQTLGQLLELAKIVSCKAGFVVYSLYDNKMSEEIAEEVKNSLVSLLENAKFMKTRIKEKYLEVLKPPLPKFSSIDDMGFLNCFMGKLEELLNYNIDPFPCLNLLVGPLVECLKFLISFLSTISNQHPELEKLYDVHWKQIIGVAYKAEYIIDSLLVGNGPLWHLMLWLSEEIKVLKAEVNKITEKQIHGCEVQHDAQISRQSPPQVTPPEIDEVVIGFQDEEEKIVDNLVYGTKKLQVVSIVGMPGLGKTHLSNRIYNKSVVKDYFDVRACCYVSQVYSRKQILTQILNQVVEPTRRMSEMTDEELAEALYKNLKGMRYLVLMDDLWDVAAWDALSRSFPDDNSGSRIMFTSRFHSLNLGSFCRKIHHLHQFSPDECWQLLQKKLFHRGNCPVELLEVGKQIARNCNGLPLTVVVIAGILARIDKKPDQWREVANKGRSVIVDDPDKQSFKVMEMSYKHLPDYLKPCFLYTGALFVHKSIPVRKLIRLWIAEGFVHNVEQRSLENIAKDYLMDLIGRSLVIIDKRKSSGSVELLRVHDLVKDFCLEKAKEKNFSQLIERVPTSHLATDVFCEQRRIGCNDPQRFVVSKVHGPHVRSLLFIGPNDSFLTRCSDISSICEKFKLLTVLDLEWIWILDSFPEGIYSLSHLKYLALCGHFRFIPSSIEKLWNLETFIVKGSMFQVNVSKYMVHVPHTIWNLVKLRHLEITGALFSQPSYRNVRRLDHLQTISTLILPYGDDMVELIKGIVNVKTLSCIFVNSQDDSESCSHLPVLASLTQLESLEVHNQAQIPDPYEFSLPSNIKRLTLSGFCLPWKKISIIGKLPNLEDLKVLSKAFEGEEWEMGDGEFPKLKFLMLQDLDIRKWSISSDDDKFPPLQQLVLQSCSLLEEVPPCLAGIPTLSMIEVSWCSETLKEIVKQIQEDQLDMGNEELKVVVK